MSWRPPRPPCRARPQDRPGARVRPARRAGARGGEPTEAERGGTAAAAASSARWRAGRGRAAGPRVLAMERAAGAAGTAVRSEAAVRARGRRRAGAVAGRGAGIARPPRCRPRVPSDFMQCPLLYRFRVIDRLPEKPSEAATRGTLVHAVLERLFDAPGRGADGPAGQVADPRPVGPAAARPGRRSSSCSPTIRRASGWRAGSARPSSWWSGGSRWRTRPGWSRPSGSCSSRAQLDSGLRLRGIIDRVDVAPTGEVRIVDYKTGKAPRPEYAEGALFQMKFYALVVWRLKRRRPAPAAAGLSGQR